MTAQAREKSAFGLLLTLVALFALAGLSLGLRFAHLGGWGYGVALGIAAAKAVLVAVFFMEILAEKPAVGFGVVAGLLLLLILLTFVVGDIVTRTVPPLSNPPGTAGRFRG
ncbi:MAG: cytochrome-c oxidase [Polyangiaceae bacterium]|jgi:cytochrome c oxidase subunit 4